MLRPVTAMEVIGRKADPVQHQKTVKDCIRYINAEIEKKFCAEVEVGRPANAIMGMPPMITQPALIELVILYRKAGWDVSYGSGAGGYLCFQIPNA